MGEFDGKAEARRAWAASPAGWTYASGAEPGTAEYLERVLARRSGWEMPWLAPLVKYKRFAGQRVLEVGCGAGYDAIDFALAGAAYVGCDLVAENIARARAHLALSGLPGQFVEADAERLPFPDASFDAYYSNGVLHHVPDIQQALREAHRVLRPGAELLILLYHRDSLFYWVTTVLYNHILRGGFLRRSLAATRSRIEFTTANARPIVNVYSRGQVRLMLSEAGFRDIRLAVRKLVAEDIPGGRRLLGWVPQVWLSRAGATVGWYVIASARRP